MPKKFRLSFLVPIALLAAGIFVSFKAFTAPDKNETLFFLSIFLYGLAVISLFFFFYFAGKKYITATKNIENRHDAKGSKIFRDDSGEWQFNKRIFDFVPALVAVYNINTGKYIYVNKTSEEIFGFSSTEILAGGFELMLSLMHPDDRDELFQKNNEALEKANKDFPAYNDNVIIEFEYRMRHKNGKYMWLHTYGIVFSRNEINQVDQILNISVDITERKETEEKLLALNNELEQKIKERTFEIKKQQEEFRNILMDAPYMISIRRGPELRLEFVNTAYYNFTKRNDIGKPFEEVSSQYKKHEVYKAVWEVYKTGQPYHGKSLPTTYDKYQTGELVDCWFDFTFIPVFDMNGGIDGVATFGFDVTELIKANKEIKKNEDRFRFLANAIPQKVWTAEPEGNINYVNEVWSNYVDIPLEDLKKWGWQKLLHPDDLDNTVKIWKQALSSGEDLEIENRLINAKGEYRWHLTRARAQKDENGKITSWVGSSTDIHDQKIVEEALKTSEDYFRQLADQTPFMIWKVDAEGICNYVNKKWIDYTGLSFEESIGLGWGQAFHPDENEAEYKKFLSCFHNRVPYYSKFRLRNTEGQYRWFLAQSNPLTTKEFSGYIGSLTDIHEQELAQQATTSLMQKKDEFMSIASHELKTPISSMKGYLQIAERLSVKQETDQLFPFIQKANNQVNKLTGLVEDLLDVTKIQAGKMEFTFSVFSIVDAIHDCVEQIQNNTEGHEIKIHTCDQVIVNADRYRVEQVIINLLSNAIKYSPDAKEVILNCEEKNGLLKISVTDFGIGIPEDKKRFVFDRFFRVHTSAQNFSGLGLGLYISSEIVKRHNGEIGLESEENNGSVFWFTLPVFSHKE